MSFSFRVQQGFWLILFLAVIIRLLYFFNIYDHPDFRHPGLDAGYHDYWARGIAFDQWTPPDGQTDPLIRSQPFFRPPGYPYFLALVYRLTGGQPVPARLVQFALGVCNIALLWLFARRWFGPRTALWAASLAAIFWGFVYYEGELLEPALLISLNWAFLIAMGYWLETRRSCWLIAAGLALGASAVVRPNTLLFAPVAAVWLVWSLPSEHRRFRHAMAAATCLGVGALLVVSPVALRNAIVGRDAVLISSNGGINLLLGQAREAVASHASDETGNWNCFDYPLLLAQASAKAGRTLKPSEVSRLYAAQARTLAFSRPRETLRLLRLKTLLFWGPLHVSNNKVEELERRDSFVLSRLPLRFSFILATALFGIATLVRQPPPRSSAQMAVLLLAMVVTTFLSFLPFISAGQYRIPIVAVLLIFTGIGLDAIFHRLQAGRWRSAIIAGFAIVLVWLLVSPNYTGYCFSPARLHLARAIAAERDGNLPLAEADYLAAIQALPSLAVAHNRLGALYARQERIPEALSCFESAVAADPASLDARSNLGLALALSGREKEAIPHFEYVLSRNPAHADARHNLALARQRISSRAPQAERPQAPPSP